MDAVGMFFQPIHWSGRVLKRINPDDMRDTMPYFPQVVHVQEESTDDLLNSFLDSLTSSHKVLEGNEQEVLDIVKDVLQNKDLSLLDDEGFIKEIVKAIFEGIDDIKETEQGVLIERLVSIDLAIINHLRNIQPSEHTKQAPMFFETIHGPLQQDVVTSSPISNRQQMSMGGFLQRFESMMQTVHHEQDLVKVAPEILKMLKQWTSQHQPLTADATDQSDQKQSHSLQLWESLVETFQKRDELVSRQFYNRDAKVSSVDVVKWLRQSLFSADASQITYASYVHNGSIPASTMTPVEQYVIYIQNQQQPEVIDQLLIKQFRQVMQTSHFLPLNHGMNQLSISIKPENLGDIFVRFIETNGEMSVKILVSSQATKRIMEANIHQLKNMFSPYQVVIEKQEHDIEQLTKDDHLHKENKDDRSDQHPEEESRGHGKNQDQEFHKILSEKV